MVKVGLTFFRTFSDDEMGIFQFPLIHSPAISNCIRFKVIQTRNPQSRFESHAGSLGSNLLDTVALVVYLYPGAGLWV